MSMIDSIKSNEYVKKILAMGTIGGFGEIVFSVNPLNVMTYDDGAEHNSSTEYAEHKIIGGKPKLEQTYKTADEVSLNITLSSMFGVNPKKELAKFEEYLEDGDVYDLIIGNAGDNSNVLGEYVITNISRKYKDIGFFGDIGKIVIVLT